MTILVLGNIDSKWIKEYIEYVLLPLGHIVEVIGDEKNCRFVDFYRSNGIVIHHSVGPDLLTRRLPFVRIMSSARRTVKANTWGEYDLIINLFVNYRHLMITAKIRGKNTKTAMYFAGSELLRKSRAAVRLYNVLLPNNDYYIMGSQTLLRDFQRKFGKKYQAKVIHFGVSAFDSIDKILNNGRVKKEKNTFCIGYSGVRAHQHLAVLDLFSKLPKELKQKATLIVPMTYMATPEYVKEVHDKLDAIGLAYRLYTEYRNNEQMAELWCGVEYIINAQWTDSLSASLLESIYAGCELISPTWLDYPEYQEMDIQKTEYRDFEELYDIITAILEGHFVSKCGSNRQVLYSMLSWESSKKQWSPLFAAMQEQSEGM